MRKAVLMLTLAACSVVKADIIPELFSVTPLGPGEFVWSYQVDLTANSRLQDGEDQFFTIYDFAGYIDGSIFAAPGWTGTTQLTGKVASGTTPVENAAILNLVFTWDGGATVTGPQDLGIFGASSEFDLETLSAFTGQSTNNTGGTADGTPLGNIGSVETPQGQQDVIPEPGTMTLLGSALLALGVWRRRGR